VDLVEQESQPIRELHLLASGCEDRIIVGGSIVSNRTLSRQQEFWARLGSSLTADATIEIHGCDSGDAAAAERLVERLSDFTGCRVLIEKPQGSLAVDRSWHRQEFTNDVVVSGGIELSTRKELILVDSGIADPESLLRDQGLQGRDPANLEWVFLDSQRDALDQITEVLKHHSNLAAVHLLSHGRDGVLTLGGHQVDLADLNEHAGLFYSWGNALSTDGDFLIYGCDVAQSSTGIEFLQKFSDLTRADVSASDDITGSEVLRGNWTLEQSFGQVNVESLNIQNYSDIFPATTATPDTSILNNKTTNNLKGSTSKDVAFTISRTNPLTSSANTTINISTDSANTTKNLLSLKSISSLNNSLESILPITTIILGSSTKPVKEVIISSKNNKLDYPQKIEIGNPRSGGDFFSVQGLPRDH
jgi:hypothetical protein